MKKIDTLFDNLNIKRMLVLFPHPDDESVMTSGLIQQAIRSGFDVEVVSLTAGEAGQIYCKGNGNSLRKIRTGEFIEAMRILGVKHFRIWNLPDGKLRHTKDLHNTLQEINWEKYGIVVSYDHSGISGHPDHISTSVELKMIISKLKAVNKPVLLWVSMVGKAKDHMVNPKVRQYLVSAEYRVALGFEERFTKWRAIKAHRSQALGKHFPLPLLLLVMLFGSEYFSVARSESTYEHKYVEFEI